MKTMPQTEWAAVLKMRDDAIRETNFSRAMNALEELQRLRDSTLALHAIMSGNQSRKERAERMQPHFQRIKKAKKELSRLGLAV